MDKVAVATPPGLTFAGSADEQEMAARVHELMRRQAVMYASDTPITTPLERLVSGLARQYPDVASEALGTQISAALDANPNVFLRQEQDGGRVVYVATKSGKLAPDSDTQRHMLRQRLNPQAQQVSTQESRAMTENWVARAATRSENFTIFSEPSAEPVPAVRPAPTRPTLPPYLQPPQVLPPLRPTTLPTLPSDEEVLVAPTPVEPEAVPVEAEPAVAVPTQPERAIEAAPIAAPEVPVEAAPVAAEPAAAVAAAPPPAAVEAPVIEAPPPAVAVVVPPTPQRPLLYSLASPEGPQTLDLSRPVDDVLAEYGATLSAMLEQALREDFRFVEFAGDWYVEDAVERFSKGDFRRIKDYLIETQEALADHAFMLDVLNRREHDPDYGRLRFSLNYRMLKEKKDFEFVGVATDRLWIVAGASPVSAPKRKPSELGLDYRHLEDKAIAALEPPLDEATPTRLDHTLTYYEYENGLLPYDAAAKRLFPGPLLEDQRAVLLRFDVPALYQSYPVELRFPLGNRGGYLVGLDTFFQENLVPGARFTIEATDVADVFAVRYERTPAQEARLLAYDERRSRFHFQPTTYYVEVTPNALLSEERFPRLNNHKHLDEAERKKGESVVISAFELIGEQLDDTGRLWASLDDLLPLVNLERPFSPGSLRAVLEGSHDYFAVDTENAGAYYYDPAKR